MTEIVWQDPPTPQLGPGNADFRNQFIEALRDRVGQWAVYPCKPKGASAVAARFKREGLESVTRKVDGHVKVFVRVPA